MSGYSQRVSVESRLEAYIAICGAAEAAEKDHNTLECQFWVALLDLIESRFPRQDFGSLG